MKNPPSTKKVVKMIKAFAVLDDDGKFLWTDNKPKPKRPATVMENITTRVPCTITYSLPKSK